MKSVESPVKRRGSPRRLGRAVLVIAFLIIVYAPIVGLMVQPQKTRTRGSWQEGENLSLPRLTWRWSSVVSFPRAFGQYFQYHFGFRRNLIRWHTTLAQRVLRKSSSEAVLEGKDGWLFLGENGIIEDYRGMLPFTAKQLQRWQAALEGRRDWLAGQGIHYLFVVCPNKHSVYSEHMPDKVNRVRERTRLDQLVEHMKEHSDLEIVDLRPSLLAMKSRHLCYQPQDTHWNGIGAFTGSREIARRLRAWYPNLPIMDMDNCKIYVQENPHTDLLRLQGRKSCTTLAHHVRPIGGFLAACRVDPDNRGGKVYQVRHSVRNDAEIGRLLMIHDSFAEFLIPFLAEHVRDALYIWSDNDSTLVQDVLDYRPDVVIHQVVERRLCTMELGPLESPPAADRSSPSPLQ